MSRLNCPACKQWEHGEIYDVRSRTSETGLVGVHRRRRCRNCGCSYKTVEVIEYELFEFALTQLEKQVGDAAAKREKQAETYQDRLRRKLHGDKGVRTDTDTEGEHLSDL